MSYNKKFHKQMIKSDPTHLNLQCQTDVEIYDEAEFDRILNKIREMDDPILSIDTVRVRQF